jgi:hypothetical protein
MVAEYRMVGSRISPGAFSYCFGGIFSPNFPARLKPQPGAAGVFNGMVNGVVNNWARLRASEFFEALSRV